MKVKSIIVLLVMALLIVSMGTLVNAQDTIKMIRMEDKTGAFEWPWYNVGKEKLLLYGHLIQAQEDYTNPHPELAKEWSISDDNLTYTFKLRDGLTWHDGEELTTEDIKWSMESFMLNPRKAPLLSGVIPSIKGAKEFADGDADSIEGIQIVDDQIIKVTLNEQNPVFSFGISQFNILPKHLLKDEDPATMHQAEFFQSPVGAGPYKIVEREPEQYTILEAFDNYCLGEPKIDKIELYSKRNPVVASESGKIDFGYIYDTESASQIQEIPSMEVTPTTTGYIRWFGLNNTRSHLKNTKVRRALYFAIDLKSIVEDLFDNQAEILYSPMPLDYWRNKDIELYEYNPEKARKLLEEANWDFDRELEVVYYYDNQETKDFMATIQYYWKQIGIEMNPRLIKGNVGEILNEKRDFDLYYGATTGFDPSTILNRFHSKNTPNTSREGYSNLVLDKAIDQAMSTLDTDKRKEMYDIVQEELMSDLPCIPLFTTYQYILESNRLDRPDINADIRRNVNWQFENWELKE